MTMKNLIQRGAAAQAPVTVGTSLRDATNTPPSVYDEAANKFAEIYGSSRMEAQRWFVVAAGCLLLATACVATLAMLVPLKEARPWVVEVNPTSGVVNKPVEILRVEPNVAVIKSELGRWAEAVYGIDPLRSSEALRWANARSAEKAVTQFAEFRARERIFERINREPDMVREVKVTAVDVSQKGTAFVFLTTSERVGAGTPSADRSKRYRVTLNYKVVPPNQEKEMLENPLGLYVTFFSDVEERAQ